MENLSINYLKSSNENLLKTFKENEMILGSLGGGSIVFWLGFSLFVYLLIMSIVGETVENIYIKNKNYKLKLKKIRNVNYNINATINLSKEIEDSELNEINEFKLSLFEKCILVICFPALIIEKLYKKLTSEGFELLSGLVLLLFLLTMVVALLIGIKNEENQKIFINNHINSSIFKGEEVTYPILKIEKTDRNFFVIYYLNNDNKLDTMEFNEDINYNKDLEISKSDLENKAIGYITIFSYDKDVKKYNDFINKNKEELESLNNNELFNRLNSFVDKADRKKQIKLVNVKYL